MDDDHLLRSRFSGTTVDVSMNRKIIFALVVFVFLTGCAAAPDPLKDAKASQLLTMTAQDAADRELARATKAAQEASAQRLADQLAGTYAMVEQGLIWIIGASLALASLGSGAGFGVAGWRVSQAVASLVELRAMLIKIDSKTGQAPFVVIRRQDGNAGVIDPNKGEFVLSGDKTVPALPASTDGANEIRLAQVTTANTKTAPEPALRWPHGLGAKTRQVVSNLVDSDPDY